MRVLIVTNVYPTQGHPYHGIFVYEQLQALKTNHSDFEYDVHYINGFGGKTEYVKSILAVNRRIDNGNYDLVHIHYGLSGIFLICPFRKKVPIITTFHGSDIQPAGGNGLLSVWVSRMAAKHSKVAIVLNDNMESMVKPFCPNTIMIPCAVNMDTFKPLPKTENNNKVQIVFPSSHERKVKNYPLFCEVMDILRLKYGIEAEERELKGMSREEIAQMYSNADLLLMTSKSEGSPQAVKEAMCCNLPCVSTPVGDVRVLLEGVKDSYVAKEHDAEELASLVALSLKHSKKGISGREKAMQLNLDDKSIADKVYNLYNRLI